MSTYMPTYLLRRSFGPAPGASRHHVHHRSVGRRNGQRRPGAQHRHPGQESELPGQLLPGRGVPLPRGRRLERAARRGGGPGLPGNRGAGAGRGRLGRQPSRRVQVCTLSYVILSYPTLPSPTPIYPILSYPILSCSVLSCYILS